MKKTYTVELEDLDLKVLWLLANGATARQIGKKVERSPRTVEIWINNMKSYFRAVNIPHMIHLAHREGVIPETEPVVMNTPYRKSA